LFDRVESCRDRYWEIPKSVRMDKGLRPDFGSADFYSGAYVVEVVEKYLTRAFRGAFPIIVDPFDVVKLSRPAPGSLASPEEVLSAFDPIIAELERKLDDAES
jgi:hypothetical protein